MKSVNSRFQGHPSTATMLARMLERDIVEGRLAPGTPLKSVREMSRCFSVSPKVVVECLDILDSRNLLDRQPRKGIYVRSPELVGGGKEVIFFAMDREPGRNIFIHRMLELLHSQHCQGRLNFTVRLVGTQTSSPVGNLSNELVKLGQMSYGDCGVIIPIGFTRRDVEAALKLPYPVIFLGDFPEDVYDDLDYVQLIPTNRRANECVAAYARERGYKRIAYLLPEQFAGDFLHEYYLELREMCLAYGIEVLPLMVPGITPDDAPSRLPDMFQNQRELLASIDLIASLYYRIPRMDFSLPDIVYLNEMDDSQVKQVRLDYDGLFEKLCNLIFELSRKDYRRNVVKMDIETRLSVPPEP